MHHLIANLNQEYLNYANLVSQHGGSTWVVGGAVRDHFFGQPTNHDIDLEVSGLEVSELQALPGYSTHPAGNRYGVWLVTPHSGKGTFEVALPQTRVRTGDGHGDETAIINPHLPITESLARRDFTMNAMAINIITGELVDPFNGGADIQDGLLRAVNTQNFGQDPLRVLRGMQFCSRFDLVADTLTVASAFDNLDGFDTLSPDRIRSEWVKWATGMFPAAGIEFLRATAWVSHFPALDNINGLEQDARWHPEGDVLEHTIQALRQVDGNDPIVVWATLLHDIGKADTTVFTGDAQTNGEWDSITSPGHAEYGAAMVVDFFRSAGFDINDRVPDWVQAVVAIVGAHMWPSSWQTQPTRRAVRRMARDIQPATIRQWATVCMADTMGRGDASHVNQDVVSVVETADRQGVVEQAPQPVVMGRHMIAAGFSPGRRMGEIIRAAADEHVNCPFDDVEDGMAWVRENFEVR